MTARTIDENGFITIPGNPITRAGVFPYLGESIGAPEPGKIYYVYRPAEEIANPDCINSFKLIPIVDDHDMIGPSAEGLLPAEQKGVHGTIGETIEFRGDVLYATIKIFSEALADQIQNGKIDLSLGYRCAYEQASGISPAGQAYDYVQRSLRGNHLALVDKARCNVAVLDSQFTYDQLDLFEKEPEMDKAAFDALEKKITDLTTLVTTKFAKDAEEEKAAEEKAAADKKAADELFEKEAAEKKAADEAAAKGETQDPAAAKAEDKKAMDAMSTTLKTAMDEIATLKKGGIKSLMGEIANRDALAQKISTVLGAFAHDSMTSDEVAAYGVEKLGIKCEKGSEKVALDGFFHARDSMPAQANGFTLDSNQPLGEKSEINAYINGTK